MQGNLRSIDTKAEQNLEQASEQALAEALAKSNPVPERSLVERSRESFAANAQSLRARLADIDIKVRDATRRKDEAIASINEAHRVWLATVEHEARQIATVLAAVSQASSTLARDPS
jgi:predicted RNase H-like HicB family nuclease